jgi:nitrite reductase/ring-hydroxylating ferredoxin subunit
MSAPSVRWLKILEPRELAEGEVRGLVCDGRWLCASRVGGQIGVIEDVCPHQGALISDGWVHDGYVVCPRHGWEFHPVTGRMPGGSEGAAPFPVEERADGVYVGIADPVRE